MAKRNRTSPLKRQREAEKRERQSKRAAKAAMKRERKLEREQSDTELTPNEDSLGEGVDAERPAAGSEPGTPPSDPVLGTPPVPLAGGDPTPA